LLISGCGGGGGGGGGNASGNLEISVIPVKITYEGSSDSDGLFASVSGSGVTGGRLFDTLKTQIIGSDLVFENAANRYQRLLTRSRGGFPPGEYTLQYYQNGDTLEFKSENLNWTTLHGFTSGVTMNWDEGSRTLTVNAPSLPGNVRYLLELYNADTGTMRRQTSDFINPNAITEYVSEPGNFKVALVANFYESGSLKAKTIFYFKDTIYVY